MEAVTSTYAYSTTNFIYEASLRQRSENGVAADAGTRQARATTPSGSGLQEGFRPAATGSAEFKPYSSPPAGEKSADSANKEQDAQIQAEVAKLKSTEAKVKAHEAAHKSAGGTMTGPVSYTYTRGPDGRSYVTGGEVPIDVSPGKTPQETISRMQQVIQAALAPADPSPQDRAVAAQAALQLQQARQQVPVPAPSETEKPPAAGAEPGETVKQASSTEAGSANPGIPPGASETAETFQPVSFYA